MAVSAACISSSPICVNAGQGKQDAYVAHLHFRRLKAAGLDH